MKRRNFIKNSLWATGALSLPSLSSSVFSMSTASTQSTNALFKKSIMWGTVGVEGSVLDKCKAIKEAGFQGFEPDSHMNRKEVIDAAKATGLEISDVCCSTHWGKPLSHPDGDVRQQGIESTIVALEDAKAYGSNAILLVPGAVNETVSYDECWTRSIESINQLIPVAEKLKVMICIENVWNSFLLSPLEACRYVDQFNSPYVKFYFDCGNILLFGWPEQWIRILGDRIGRIHIKDFNRQRAYQKGFGNGFETELGEADVNWRLVMEALRKNYQHQWLTTEHGYSRTLDDLKNLYKRLDKIIHL